MDDQPTGATSETTTRDEGAADARPEGGGLSRGETGSSSHGGSKRTAREAFNEITERTERTKTDRDKLYKDLIKEQAERDSERKNREATLNARLLTLNNYAQENGMTWEERDELTKKIAEEELYKK